MKLEDLIENEGRKQVQQIIHNDIETVEGQIAEVQKEINAVKAQMALYDNAERRKAITKKFREMMGKYLFELEVHNLAHENLHVYSSVSETGSDLPRALLAYYYGILHLMKENSTAAFCPIVIDSPNQQDQDIVNLKKMLSFIHERRPKDSQVVLGLVDDCGVEFDGSVIELSDKNQLLHTRDYAAISAEVRDLLDKVRLSDAEEQSVGRARRASAPLLGP